ncbi:MAG: hypothetical protein SGPRY_014328 [Prymnesium sp.]
MLALPGSASYVSEKQRFAKGVSLDEKPEFQAADEAHRTRAKQAKDERNRYYLQRTEAVSHMHCMPCGTPLPYVQLTKNLQSKQDASAERRLDALFEQRVRYNSAIALEQRATLKLL